MPPIPSPSWQITTLDTVDSTNAHALRKIRELWQLHQSPHASVFIAHRQTAGRGQHNRAWQSPPGGLYLSLILEKIDQSLRDKLALIAGLAVAQSLTHLQIPNITLRWPNDLMLAEKKVGGILCEAIAEGPRWAAVIGIGLNITTRPQDFPPDLRQFATSFAEHTVQPLDPSQLTTHLLAQFADTLAQAHQSGISQIAAQAAAFDFLAGKSVEIRDADRILTGIAQGLGPQGQLLLQTPEGPVEFTTGTLLSVAGQRIRPLSG